MNNYTEEQIDNITERQEKALKLIEELNFRVSVVMTWENNGNDTFSVKPLPYLQDTRYIKQGDTFVDSIKAEEVTPETEITVPTE